MGEEQFRLPASSFDVVIRILEAYVRSSRGPVKLDDVAQRGAMGRTLVSGNNAFLTSVGLIEGGNLKTLTELGREVALASGHPESVEFAQAWHKVSESSEYLQRIVDAVRIRRGMTTDALTSHIVLTAGVPKSNSSLTGARTVIDLLKAAGRLQESDGNFRVDTRAEAELSYPKAQAADEVPPLQVAVDRAGTGTTVSINVTINLNLNADADFNLSGLGQELARMIRHINDAEVEGG